MQFEHALLRTATTGKDRNERLTVPYAPEPSLIGSPCSVVAKTMSSALICQSLQGRSGRSTDELTPLPCVPIVAPDEAALTVLAWLLDTPSPSLLSDDSRCV